LEADVYAFARYSVRAKTKLILFLSFIFFFMIFPAVPSHAQAHTGVPHDAAQEPGDSDPGRDRIVRDMAKKANLERQAALKNDTDRLVKLTSELKEYVDKSNENTLSLDVMKKAEEIEKLAKSVKEKMRGLN
jgi:hypothetical protein